MRLGYRYDAAGRRTGLTYPDGRQAGWAYDGAGRAVALTETDGGTWTATRNGAGALRGLALPNGERAGWAYDAAGRPISTTLVSGTTTVFSQTATLDAAGQRTALDDSWGHTSYGYDAAGRLARALYPDGTSEADGYDAAGNRLVVTSTSALSGTAVTTNCYDAAAQLTTSSNSAQGTTSYSYDGAGNQTGSAGPQGTTTNTYNDLGQLTHVAGPTTNVGYISDGQGDRLRSLAQGAPQWQIQTLAQDVAGGGLSSIASDGTQDYTYLEPGKGQAPLAGSNQATGQTTYLGTDLLGSVRVATNGANQVIGAGAYDAWGAARPTTANAGGQTQLAGLQGATPFGYAGQYRDAGANTYDMRARAYDPAQGRFLSVDPLVDQTGQPYSYANGNPANNADPSGLFAFPHYTQDDGPGDPAFASLVKQTIAEGFRREDHSGLTLVGGAPYGVPGLDILSFSPSLAADSHPVGDAYAIVRDRGGDGKKGWFGTQFSESYQQEVNDLERPGGPLDRARVAGLRLRMDSGRTCYANTRVDLERGRTYPISLGDFSTGYQLNRLPSYYRYYPFTYGGVPYIALARKLRNGVIGYTTCHRGDPGFLEEGPDPYQAEDPAAEACGDTGAACQLAAIEENVRVDGAGTYRQLMDAQSGGLARAVAFVKFAVVSVPSAVVAAFYVDGARVLVSRNAGEGEKDLAAVSLLPLPDEPLTGGLRVTARVLDAASLRALGATLRTGRKLGLLVRTEHGLQVEAAPAADQQQLAQALQTAQDVRGFAKAPGCTPCFPAGTLVTTPRGKVAIETLRAGDAVLAEDPKAGVVRAERLERVVVEPALPLVAVDLSDGSVLRATPNHAFWVDGGRGLHGAGWVLAARLEPGDRLRTAGGKRVAVARVLQHAGRAVVYTLTVARDHTFFVGSAQVLVHNYNACVLAIRPKDSPWNLPNVRERGRVIEAMYLSTGNVIELHNYLVIDDFIPATGAATSIKSIDLTTGRYQSESYFRNKLNTYARALNDFSGASQGGINTTSTGTPIRSRTLLLVFEPLAADAKQSRILQEDSVLSSGGKATVASYLC